MKEDKVVAVGPIIKGGGKKKKRVKNPWDSSESEFEKGDTDESGEESLREEACQMMC